MVYGKRPFGHGLTQKSIMNSGVILNAKEVQFPDNVVVSEEAKRFIKKCLEIDPDIRYDPTQAAIDAYLKDPTNPD